MKSKKKNKERISPIDLEISETDVGFSLIFKDKVLLTEYGSPVEHQAKYLLEHIISEFDGYGHITISNEIITKPKFFGSYSLFSIQKEWVESNKDDVTLYFELVLLNDPILHPLAGPEQIEQRARWAPVDKWLENNIEELREYAFFYRYKDEDISDNYDTDSEIAAKKLKIEKQITDLKNIYLQLLPEQKTVIQLLMAIHNGPVLFPMALVLGKCNIAEYALGVMAGQAILSEVFGDVDDKSHRGLFESFRADARVALEYITAYQYGTQNQRLKELIANGENAKQEFKSTLRWNIHAERSDEAITHACIKTIAALLNTNGGNLLIGVADNGDIVGIELDKFENNDKFQLHLINFLKTNLGETVTTNLAIELIPTLALKTVCLVQCSPSKTPIFCKLKNGEEHFYVRTGPGTTKLPPSELVQYVSSHFK